MYLINGQLPGPLVDVDEGDDIEIFVRNDLNVETTMHWHGESLSFRRAAEHGLKQRSLVRATAARYTKYGWRAGCHTGQHLF